MPRAGLQPTPLSSATPRFPLARTRLDSVASAWLASGAAGFGVWLGDTNLEYWPAGATAEIPDLTARVPGVPAAFRIGIAGLDASARPRLEADASVLGDLASVESDIEAMTSELAERQDELLALYELIRSTRSQLDLHLTLGSLARQMTRLLKASLGFAMVMLDDGRHLLAAAPPGWIDADAVSSILSNVQGSRARELLLAPRVGPGHPSGRPRHVLALPVTVAKATACIGVGREGRAFSAPEVKLAEAVAEQAGAYIENALFYHESVQQVRLETEMRMAAEVQRHLLPREWPSVAGLDLYASATPASAVGGDFYDVLPVAPGRLFVALGDVTGKGAAAALVMSMTHAALRSAVRLAGAADPADVLRHTIASVYEDFDALGMYATALLGCYDAGAREVRLVSAGHSPVVHRPASGPSTLIVPEEAPLGMLDGCSSESRGFSLGPGDVLVVATDGFNEARDPDDACFGTERLLAIVDESWERPAAAIAAAISDAVRRFQRGRAPEDDQTLVVLRGV
jgi:sigma-B regulation protein RsbU (phosphoserine phosphatase)